MLLVVACGGADRGESGEIVEAGSLSVFSFHVGDCWNGFEVGELESVDAVPCDQPHQAEVFGLVDSPGGADEPFPGEEAIARFAEDRCLEAFEPYVGLSYELSEIYFSSLDPTKDSWERQGDREVICFLGYQDDRRTTGSLRGAGR